MSSNICEAIVRTLRWREWALVLCAVIAPAGWAMEHPVSAQEAATSSAPIDAANIQELRSRVGQAVTVRGEVSRIGQSQSGNRFINFDENPELTVFISSDDVGRFRPEPPEKIYTGKSVEVRGKLERYQGKLQLRVRDPEQMAIVEAASRPDSRADLPPPAVELKQTGRDSWTSPAGLIYAGRDPDGRTRREHVLRHAKDDPNREGPHGVFDGEEELAFAWIDAAWRKIGSEKIRPRVEDGRDVYTVNMGRRVGWLGGETGRTEGHPPLKRIFLVLRRGTTEVITAFPK